MDPIRDPSWVPPYLLACSRASLGHSVASASQVHNFPSSLNVRMMWRNALYEVHMNDQPSAEWRAYGAYLKVGSSMLVFDAACGGSVLGRRSGPQT